MIFRKEHFEYDWQKRAETAEEIEDCIERGIEVPNANQLLDPERYAPGFVHEMHVYCFVCGDKLTVPLIMWNGFDGHSLEDGKQIWMHPNCAHRLSEHLEKDWKKI
jgi:hypothetical protein